MNPRGRGGCKGLRDTGPPVDGVRLVVVPREQGMGHSVGKQVKSVLQANGILKCDYIIIYFTNPLLFHPHFLLL